jgi:hypothetical protein
MTANGRSLTDATPHCDLPGRPLTAREPPNPLLHGIIPLTTQKGHLATFEV